MSEQPASIEPASMTESMMAPTVPRTGLILDRDHIDVSFLNSLWKVEDVADIGLLLADGHAGVSRRDLGFAHEKKVDVVRRQRIVERRLNGGSRGDRPHQMRRDDDREIGFVLLI